MSLAPPSSLWALTQPQVWAALSSFLPIAPSGPSVALILCVTSTQRIKSRMKRQRVCSPIAGNKAFRRGGRGPEEVTQRKEPLSRLWGLSFWASDLVYCSLHCRKGFPDKIGVSGQRFWMSPWDPGEAQRHVPYTTLSKLCIPLSPPQEFQLLHSTPCKARDPSGFG